MLIFPYEDGVEIHRLKLATHVDAQAVGTHQQISQRLFRYRRLTAIAFKDLMALYFVDHLKCVAVFDGQNPEADVPQDLGEYAAKSKHDHRAKLRVVQQANDDLNAPIYHLLDLNTLDAGFGVG